MCYESIEKTEYPGVEKAWAAMARESSMVEDSWVHRCTSSVEEAFAWLELVAYLDLGTTGYSVVDADMQQVVVADDLMPSVAAAEDTGNAVEEWSGYSSLQLAHCCLAGFVCSYCHCTNVVDCCQYGWARGLKSPQHRVRLDETRVVSLR